FYGLHGDFNFIGQCKYKSKKNDFINPSDIRDFIGTVSDQPVGIVENLETTLLQISIDLKKIKDVKIKNEYHEDMNIVENIEISVNNQQYNFFNIFSVTGQGNANIKI
ncbi:6376_t:CDS:2, partial [Funneliformis caledonium]